MKTDWNELERVLKANTAHDWSDDETAYLQEAYDDIEKMWVEATGDIEKPNVILIGEAPLYGRMKSYIYSPDVAHSSFLYLNDIPGADANADHKKVEMLAAMKSRGVIVLDLLPYALNEEDNPNYNYNKDLKGDAYRKLIEAVFPVYSKLRLEELLLRNPKAKLVFRYKRSEKAVGHLLRQYNAGNSVPSISGTNMSMDRAKFHKIIESVER
ncbi:MAG: hypothetical protein ABJN04_04415 [Hyphomicrobiales bacterium]